MSMTRGERRAMKALMRGVALLMRYKSWEMLRKFEGVKKGVERRKWALRLQEEVTWLFDEERKL